MAVTGRIHAAFRWTAIASPAQPAKQTATTPTERAFSGKNCQPRNVETPRSTAPSESVMTTSNATPATRRRVP
jgi:hypothetical protein